MVTVVLLLLKECLAACMVFYAIEQFLRHFEAKTNKLSREEQLVLEEKKVDALLAEHDIELERQIDSLPKVLKINSSETYTTSKTMAEQDTKKKKSKAR